MLNRSSFPKQMKNWKKKKTKKKTKGKKKK